MSDVFSAISDPTRRQILDALASKGLTVSELVNITGEGQPTVSKHLKTLREAGLVNVEAAGQSRVYSLEANGFADAAAWMANFAPAVIGSAAGQVVASAANDLDAKLQVKLGEAGEQVGSWLAAGATWLGSQLQEKLAQADVDAKKLGRDLGRQLAEAKAGALDKAGELSDDLLDEVAEVKAKVTKKIQEVTKSGSKSPAKPVAKKPAAKKTATKKPAAKSPVVTVVDADADEF